MYARYTEYLIDLLNNPVTNELINNALSHYPLYTPVKVYDLIPNREELNKRLLEHFKHHEIGFETVGRFIDELRITMNEIMPYYNEMFKTIEIMCELPSPFDNVDVVEEYTEERKSNVQSTETNISETRDKTETTGIDEQAYKKVGSGTPQGVISETAHLMEDIRYADGIEWYKANNSNDGETISEGEGTNERESKGTSTDTIKHTFTKKGNQGVNTYAHDMNEFRTAIIDVVNQIINDERVQQLFMLVF